MVDFDKFHAVRIAEFERTGGCATEGLTIRDYFAAKAMQAMLSDKRYEDVMIARASYDLADHMMKERYKTDQEPCTVEEAFGL